MSSFVPDNLSFHNKSMLPKSFQWEIYRGLNPDLEQNGIVSQSSVEKHYQEFGIAEKRIYRVQDAYPGFDPVRYRLLNADLKDLSEDQLERHWVLHGRFENRRYTDERSHTPKDSLYSLYPDFKPLEYGAKYPDLQELSPPDLERHWMDHGRFEGRSYRQSPSSVLERPAKQPNFPDIMKSRTCILYAYYERRNEHKNQTNLAFFLKYGCSRKDWNQDGVEIVIIVNGYQCEVVIPKDPRIHVIREENCSDFEAWENGMRYMEERERRPIHEAFQYLCFINSSSSGPFMEADSASHWLVPFYKRMVLTGALSCGTYINVLTSLNPGGPGLRISSHFMLLRTEEGVIKAMRESQITNVHPQSVSRIERYTNTVFGHKRNKEDAILTGEYGFSRTILDAGYGIACLYPTVPEEREEFQHPNNYLLKGTVFIKNIWRDAYSYASEPVLADYCEAFIEKRLGMRDPLQTTEPVLWDYKHIQRKSVEYDSGNTKRLWSSLSEFHTKYGRAEEYVVFPKVSSMTITDSPLRPHGSSVCIYAHFDKDNIIRDYVVQGLKALMILGYEVIFYTSSSAIYNMDLPFQIHLVENGGPGTDYRMWHDALKGIILSGALYDWILLLNDSLLFPMYGVDQMRKTIERMRSTSDFWGHWDSREVDWHIMAVPFEFHWRCLNDVFFVIDSAVPLCSKYEDYINLIETKLPHYLREKGFRWSVVVPMEGIEQELPKDVKLLCPSHNPLTFWSWVYNRDAFAIKWKYVISYMKAGMISPEFNYLARYLWFGPDGTLSRAEQDGFFMKSEAFWERIRDI